MTNIEKIKANYDVHSHRAEVINDLLENHLPHGYSSIVVEKSKEKGLLISKQTVRNVKSLIKFDINVLLILIEVAVENKNNIIAAKKNIEKLIQ